MPKKLSRRPRVRIIQFEVELGPYQSPSTKKYVLWTSHLAKGKHSDRFMSVVQQITRPGNLGDRVHNPVLFQKIVLPHGNEYKAKWCYRRAQRALYYLLKGELAKMTRPVLRVRPGGFDWYSFEPGASTSVLGEWRRQVMDTVAGQLGNWDRIDADEAARQTTTNNERQEN